MIMSKLKTRGLIALFLALVICAMGYTPPSNAASEQPASSAPPDELQAASATTPQPHEFDCLPHAARISGIVTDIAIAGGTAHNAGCTVVSLAHEDGCQSKLIIDAGTCQLTRDEWTLGTLLTAWIDIAFDDAPEASDHHAMLEYTALAIIVGPVPEAAIT